MRNKMWMIGVCLLVISSICPRAWAVNFYLNPESTNVSVGDVFGVDIGFNNDENVLFNGVVLTFSYDGSYLELQDTDAGNMAGSGSGPGGDNIMDANHFDGWNTGLEMIANQQQNWMSAHPCAVHYEVMYGVNALRDGIFGRAYFKALKVISSTDLMFGLYYGQDESLYIDAGDNLVNVTGNLGASVNVVPEPGSFMLLGSGLSGLMLLGRRKRLLSTEY